MQTCRTGIIRENHPANFQGPKRVPPVIIESPEGPYYASLTFTNGDILVRVSRSDRPKGQRLVCMNIYDSVFHVVANKVYNTLLKCNRRQKSQTLEILDSINPDEWAPEDA